MGKKPIIGALLAVVAAYCAYPYVTLYRLGQAIRAGDAATLVTMVDWPSVREGIKEDICDLVVDGPAKAKAGYQLPPFGAGFVRGIATSAVDARVTPEALVAAAHQPSPRTVANGAAVRIVWAFFGGPTQFLVDLRAPGPTQPIRLRMDLRAGAWRVTRVWLPLQLLAEANERT